MRMTKGAWRSCASLFGRTGWPIIDEEDKS